jgi:hypothetical protein
MEQKKYKIIKFNYKKLINEAGVEKIKLSFNTKTQIDFKNPYSIKYSTNIFEKLIDNIDNIQFAEESYDSETKEFTYIYKN